MKRPLDEVYAIHPGASASQNSPAARSAAVIPRTVLAFALSLAGCTTPSPVTSAGDAAVPASATPSAVAPEIPPTEPPVQLRGADRVEIEVDVRGADLALDDGAKLHAEGSRDPVRLSFARITTPKKNRHQISWTYSVETSAAAKLTIDVPYEPLPRSKRPCNGTPYDGLSFKGERTRDGGVESFSWSTSQHDSSSARLLLRPGEDGVEAPLRARFALFDTFPCH